MAVDLHTGLEEPPLPALDTCPRTLAIYKPGVPMTGVNHHFAWSGSVPMTGTLRCTLCGQRMAASGSKP